MAMKSKRFSSLIILLGLSICTALTAQDKLPGNTDLPSSRSELQKLSAFEKGTYTHSIEDFISTPQQSDFQLSPSGKYLSYLEKANAVTRKLMIRDLTNGETRMALQEGKETIGRYFWKTDDRLLMLWDKGGDELYQLFAVDRDGGNFQALTPDEKVQVRILHPLPQLKAHIIISMNKEKPDQFDPYKINTRTGELEKLFNNQLDNGIASDFYFSDKGELRAYDVLENATDYVLYYRTQVGAPFEKVVRMGSGDWFQILTFVEDKNNPHLAYVLSNLGKDTKALISYDLKAKKVVKTLFEHPRYDSEKLSYAVSRQEIDYYQFNGVKRQIIPVSKVYQSLHQRFSAYFGEHIYSLINVSADEKKYLLKVTSPTLYGKYYLYTKEEDHFQELINLKPQLKEAEMAKMSPFSFYSRDSLMIEGYFFKPKHIAAGEQAPLILIPHGGPYDIRDNYQFIAYAQLLANRGYGVLQINFRGSIGFGKRFQKAGFKQVGRNMLHDLEDGLAYILAKETWIDKSRIGAFGASYGGLATLQSLIQSPDIFVCGAEVAGPTNLFTLFESFPPFWKEFIAGFYRQWYDPTIAEEAAIIKEISPFFHLDKIEQPLFIAHGANDPRVVIQESDQVVERLRAKGLDVPYLVRYNEGHRWQKDENWIVLYETLLGFFAKHLKK